VVRIEASVECRLSTESIRECNLERACKRDEREKERNHHLERERERYKGKRYICVMYIFIQSALGRARAREREYEGMRPDTTDAIPRNDVRKPFPEHTPRGTVRFLIYEVHLDTILAQVASATTSPVGALNLMYNLDSQASFLSPRPLSPMHSNKGNEIPFLRATRLSAIYSGEHRCKCGMKTCSEDVISVAGGTMKS
ncbi:hypothetical protein ALC57_13390, partial [Trachymyrmex cornetzi]